MAGWNEKILRGMGRTSSLISSTAAATIYNASRYIARKEVNF